MSDDTEGGPRHLSRGWGGAIGIAVVACLVAVATMEGLLALALRHPGSLPAYVLGAVRGVHAMAEWPFPQLLPECTRWDPEVTYTLRPPGCTVHDREFTVRYDVNAAGLRDDASALDRPEVIVSGDSYAMGWGIERPGTIAEQVKRHLRRRVLNAAVPSYGTARELTLFDRLDRSALRVVVLQFCWNDVDENRTWVVKQGRLPVTPRDAFERAIAEHVRSLAYWPGKYLTSLVYLVARRYGFPIGPATAGAVSDEVRGAVGDLVAVLEAHREAIAGRPIVVLPLCGHETEVAAELRARARVAEARSVARLVTVLDPAPLLEPRDFFPLDGHLNPRGQRLVGRLVTRELVRRGITRGRSLD